MKPIKISDNVIIGEKLTLFAGPCVAESMDVCLKTGEFIAGLCEKLDVQYVFKASYDKANRSGAASFRGPGLEEGLRMLAKIKAELGVPVVTDIHEHEEVAAVAEVADVLQIPAFLCRQTSLLQAAARTGRPVNVKKGQFMAPEDMSGALEKIRAAGGKDILLTERGTFFGYHNLVVDMRSLTIMRGLGVPVVFDATHSVQLPGGLGNASGGQREFVGSLSRAAAATGIDVLFTEVHPDPDNALCDGPNSLDFAGLEKVLKEVKQIYDITK